MHSADTSAAALASALRTVDSLQPTIDAANQLLADQAAAIDAAIAFGESRLHSQLFDAAEQVSRMLADAELSLHSQLTDSAERVNRILASVDWGWRDQLNQAALALNRLAQDRIRALDGINLALDTTTLNRLLNEVDTWRNLTREQRSQALDAAQTAYANMASEPAGDVLPDDLAVAVRDIADAETEYLPFEVSRQAFTLFVGAVILLSLMTMAFTSEIADGAVGKAIELSPLALLAMHAAGALWDRHNGEQGNNQSASNED